jgi:hypothetical protein
MEFVLSKKEFLTKTADRSVPWIFQRYINCGATKCEVQYYYSGKHDKIQVQCGFAIYLSCPGALDGRTK